jgi:hypothetical protein
MAAAAEIVRVIQPPRAMNLREARKELGLGQSPGAFGTNADQALASWLSPASRIEIVETTQWRVDLPVADIYIPGTFGDRWNIWGTMDSQPPQGVTAATNTLATPGVFPADMLIRGIRVRFLVTPEGRLIPGNYLNVDPSQSNLPVSVDTWTQNDLTANALGLAGEQSLLPAHCLYGFPSWKVAYNAVCAYELVVLKNHQEQLIREPLTQVANIQPFSEAMAAGLAFACAQEAVLSLNNRLLTMVDQQFLPDFFERYGSVSAQTSAAPTYANVSLMTPSRERTAQSAIFGAIGIPQDMLSRSPYMFPVPVFWPHGVPMAINFQANNNAYQADTQRWLSLTGGVGGQQGQDLNMPISNVSGLNGFMPTPRVQTYPIISVEQTLDPGNPILVTQTIQTNMAMLKFGPLLVEIGVIGYRMTNPDWGPAVARAIKAGSVMAPMGYGDLTSYLQSAT